MIERAGARAENPGPRPLYSRHLQRGREVPNPPRPAMTTADPKVQKAVRRLPAVMLELKQMEARKVHPHRPVWEILQDGAWKGQAAFLIGGGPSLKGFDFERLRGLGRVIAINRALEYIPWADILFFMDNRFYQMVHKKPEMKEKWEAFQGIKIFLNMAGRLYEDVYSVRKLGRVGLSNSLKTGIFHGNNSGVGAINLAFCLGAKPIYLLGYDCAFQGKQTHFHSGYGMVQHEGSVKSFIKDFDRLNRYIVRTSAKVINLNPKSGCRSFPFSTFEEVLNERAKRQGLGDDVAPVQGPGNGGPSPGDQEGGLLLGARPCQEDQPFHRPGGEAPGQDLGGEQAG